MIDTMSQHGGQIDGRLVQHRCRCVTFLMAKLLACSVPRRIWPAGDVILHQPCFRVVFQLLHRQLGLVIRPVDQNRPERAAIMPAMVGTVAFGEILEAMVALGEPGAGDGQGCRTPAPCRPRSWQPHQRAEGDQHLDDRHPLSTAMATLGRPARGGSVWRTRRVSVRSPARPPWSASPAGDRQP